jgi:hypothetical protein
MILMTTVILISLISPMLEGQRMPEVLYNTDPGVQGPIWISADAAIDPSGQINEKLFLPSIRSTLKSFFAQSQTDGCFIVEENFTERMNPPDRTSLDRAVLHSNLVFLGHITEVAYGFHFYIPGKLLRIKPSDVLHGKALLDFYYVFYPVAEFEAGPYRICKSDARYPSAPVLLGDELLIMVPDTRVRTATDPFLELEESSSVVVLREQGAPGLPDQFDDLAKEGLAPSYQNRAELITAVREAVNKKKAMPVTKKAGTRCGFLAASRGRLS